LKLRYFAIPKFNNLVVGNLLVNNSSNMCSNLRKEKGLKYRAYVLLIHEKSRPQKSHATVPLNALKIKIFV